MIVLIVLAVVQVICVMFALLTIMCCRFLLKILTKNLNDANRTTLSRCTMDLCKAQSHRISSTNLAIDVLMSTFMCAVAVYGIPTLSQSLQGISSTQLCNDQNLCMNYCSSDQCAMYCPGSPNSTSYPCACFDPVVSVHGRGTLQIGVATCLIVWALLGIVIKTCLICSEYDYSPQARLFERIYYGSLKNPIARWFHLKQARLFCSMWLLLAILVVIVLMIPLIVIANSAVTGTAHTNGPIAGPESYTYVGYVILLFAAVLYVVEGSLIFLPWSLWDLFNHHEFKLANGRREQWPRLGTPIIPNPLSLRSVPRRKAVLLLFSAIFVVWAIGVVGVLSAEWGACDAQAAVQACINARRFPLGLALLSCVFCYAILIAMLLVKDKPFSVADLLEHSAEDNFGLVMCREAFVREMKKALGTIRDSDGVGDGSEGKCYPFDVRISTFLASQARIELCVVVSYRWADERIYKSGRAPAFVHLSHPSCAGFDWTVRLSEPQVRRLVEGLERATEDYIWMDQFCVPQNSGAGGAAGPADRKAKVQAALIPRMTSLYACGGRVVTLDNSGEEGVAASDWYQHRLWCFQEYCLPPRSNLEVLRLAAVGAGGLPETFRERDRIERTWFRREAARCSAGLFDPDLDEIWVDWVLAGDASLEASLDARVRRIGSSEYHGELVHKTFASNTNDTLSALAQPFFGVVMTRPSTRAALVRSLVADLLASQSSIRVISNTSGPWPPQEPGASYPASFILRLAGVYEDLGRRFLDEGLCRPALTQLTEALKMCLPLLGAGREADRRVASLLHHAAVAHEHALAEKPSSAHAPEGPARKEPVAGADSRTAPAAGLCGRDDDSGAEGDAPSQAAQVATAAVKTPAPAPASARGTTSWEREESSAVAVTKAKAAGAGSRSRSGSRIVTSTAPPADTTAAGEACRPPWRATAAVAVRSPGGMGSS